MPHQVDTGEITLVCQHCGQPFTYTKTSGRRRKYCSLRCQRAGAPKTGATGELRTVSSVCQHCDEPFTYERNTGVLRKYCSERCKANAAAARRVSPERRCTCGSVEVPKVGRPVCPDCRKDGRDRKGYNRIRRLALYGLTQQEFDDLLTLQRGRCAVCASDDPGSRGWFIDHDHACCAGIGSCGQCVRGLLCHDCNLLLGHAKDSTDILDRAKKYLVNNAQFHLKLQVVRSG